MIRQHSRWLVVALAGVLIAGCGSSSSTPSKSTPAQVISVTQPAATGTTSTSATTTRTAASKSPPATSIVPTSPAGVAQAVAECKSIIQRDPTLSSSLKAKVEGICNKAAHGNLSGARAAAKEVCAEVINASPIPSAAKAEALAACQHS
jgi:hypothetical protein